MLMFFQFVNLLFFASVILPGKAGILFTCPHQGQGTRSIDPAQVRL